MNPDRLLLDTHVYLWWRRNDPRLSSDARRAIADAALVFVSIATAWEAAIKISLGRLTMDETFQEGIAASEFRPLPITLAHADAVARLPFHHCDPFDRLLVAQSLIENLTFVTRDRQIEPYGINIVWT